MRPILFTIPFLNLPLFTYGVMAMLGFLAALLVARWRARRIGISPDQVTDLLLWALPAGIIGSRIAYILTYPPPFPLTRWTLTEAVAIWKGGLVFYGGFIGALVVAIILCRLYRLRLLAMFDVTAPSLALGHAFGRVGCFLNGCCYGIAMPRGSFLAVVYPNDAYQYSVQGASLDGPHRMIAFRTGTPVFPSQLLESFNLLVIFILLSLYFRCRKGIGEVGGLYMILYSVARFIDEFFRGDTRPNGGFSQAQMISIVLFFAGWVLFVYARGKSDAPKLSQES